ncbi:polyprenol reductase-like [Phlebotomus argentipes]|uniref:polyprenol reductase-like n=1 Tax=Phlebotomus argentipes TaxID=94469 RepID=UPI002892A439|nr:polyprenol reductase-like [Phlebotomus argentipes]
MWEITPMELLYSSMIASVMLLGCLVSAVEPHLPAFLTQTFRYGKHSLKARRNALVDRLEIPKSSFRHFYVFALILSGFTFYLVMRTYVGGKSPPDTLLVLLDFFCGKKRTVKGNALTTVLATSCLLLQCLRRFWETHFVQVFSKSSRINVAHYLVGYLHYFGAVVAILAHSEGFVTPVSAHLAWAQLNWRVITSAVVFIFAWRQQWRANDSLARLRKNSSGQVVTEKHLMPAGGFFDLISSPHMSFECLMYVALVPALAGNTDWLLVTAWVIANQAQVAHFTHIWYREAFPNYPKSRKALIPGVF